MIDPLTRRLIAHHIADLSDGNLRSLILKVAEKEPTAVVAAITDKGPDTIATEEGDVFQTSGAPPRPAIPDISPAPKRKRSEIRRPATLQDRLKAIAQHETMSSSDKQRLSIILKSDDDQDWSGEDFEHFISYVGLHELMDNPGHHALKKRAGVYSSVDYFRTTYPAEFYELAPRLSACLAKSPKGQDDHGQK